MRLVIPPEDLWMRREKVRQKGFHHTEETKRKMRLALLGRKLSEEHKGRISLAKLGRKFSEERKEKMRLGAIGRKSHIPTEEHKRKLSLALLEYEFTEDHKKNISLALEGREFSEEHKKKLSLAQQGKIGEASPSWRGGISNEPYPFDFNNQLKETIRMRDNYTCQLCGLAGYPVHHINYIKEDILPMNLITLCVSCNSTVNGERAYYQMMFEARIKEIYNGEGKTKDAVDNTA